MSPIDFALEWLRALPVAYQAGMLIVGLLALWLGLLLATRRK